MTRLSALLVAAGLAAAASGCAHCDTCDNFPVPCTGPDCAGPLGVYGMPSGPTSYVGPATAGPGATALPPGASLGPVIDSAGPAPAPPGGSSRPSLPAPGPAIESRPSAPAGNAPSPPPPGDPSRTRPGS